MKLVHKSIRRASMQQAAKRREDKGAATDPHSRWPLTWDPECNVSLVKLQASIASRLAWTVIAGAWPVRRNMMLRRN